MKRKEGEVQVPGTHGALNGGRGGAAALCSVPAAPGSAHERNESLLRRGDTKAREPSLAVSSLGWHSEDSGSKLASAPYRSRAHRQNARPL